MLSIVVGTRPDCIKMAPVIAECKNRGIPLEVVHTGQHADLWKGTGVAPDRFADPVRVGGPLIVQGDTRTAYDAAEGHAGFLIHVEAGVRSWHPLHPAPEEGYRVAIDERADVAYCPTEWNLANLRAEGFQGEVLVTGNPGVDALLARQRPIPESQRLNIVVVTLHRRESWGLPMEGIVHGLLEVASRHPMTQFHCPLHPNGALERALRAVTLPSNLRMGPPLAYGTFLNKLAHAQAVLTDSGGVQEDACTLGIPCVVAREVTDRPESVQSGHAIVCGRSPERVETALTAAVSGGLCREPGLVFGDGKAAERIAAHLAAMTWD
jgi:UDP-N-acetylglucosamine 2-epimerase (non-hydrolysing)